MGKSLIIAEKPSVAADIARALGGFKKDGDFSRATIRPLVRRRPPGRAGRAEGDEIKRGKWSFANLPVIPEEFALKPIERSEGRLRLLKKLMKRADVTA